MTTVFSLIALGAFLLLVCSLPGACMDHKRDLRRTEPVLVVEITIDLTEFYERLRATTVSTEEAAASMRRFGEAFNE